jgi:hypothetical protein
MEAKKSLSLTDNFTVDPTAFLRATNIKITCPKCKKKFHVDNYPGHEKYENELESGNNSNNNFNNNNLNINNANKLNPTHIYAPGDSKSFKELKKNDPFAMTLNVNDSERRLKTNEDFLKYSQSENTNRIEIPMTELTPGKNLNIQFNGLDRECKEKLFKLSEKVKEDLVSIKSKCNICYKLLNVNEIIVTLPQCFHNFHLDHLREWVELNTVCPVCKLDIKQSLDAGY